MVEETDAGVQNQQQQLGRSSPPAPRCETRQKLVEGVATEEGEDAGEDDIEPSEVQEGGEGEGHTVALDVGVGAKSALVVATKSLGSNVKEEGAEGDLTELGQVASYSASDFR